MLFVTTPAALVDASVNIVLRFFREVRSRIFFLDIERLERFRDVRFLPMERRDDLFLYRLEPRKLWLLARLGAIAISEVDNFASWVVSELGLGHFGCPECGRGGLYIGRGEGKEERRL